MDRNSLFDNPFAIIILFFLVAFVNIILPIYFISILLAGVVFVAFIRAVEKRYTYILICIIFIFNLIEISQGLKIFSLSLWSYFIYLFILPNIKSLFASKYLLLLVKVFIFYMGIGILFYFSGVFTLDIVSILVLNYILDIIMVSWII